MTQLRTITFVFPNMDMREQDWNHWFASLLQGIPGSQGEGLVFTSAQEHALPQTAFRSAAVNSPMIVFDAEGLELDVHIGPLTLTAGNNASTVDWVSMSSDQEMHPIRSENNHDALPMSKFYDLLLDKLVGIDHSGINIPSSCLQHAEWEAIISQIAKVCNLYRYPDEDWPFIIPADEAEFRADIASFAFKRTPKFEWVYDSYTDKPIFQFALETTLSQAEAELQFPAPAGFAIPGLDHIFRSVIVDSPWQANFTIRMDLYYKSEQVELSDWESGEWLIKSGGRISG